MQAKVLSDTIESFAAKVDAERMSIHSRRRVPRSFIPLSLQAYTLSEIKGARLTFSLVVKPQNADSITVAQPIVRFRAK